MRVLAKYTTFASLCEQIYKWRQVLPDIGKANPTKKLTSGGMKILVERPAFIQCGFVGGPGGESFAAFHGV